jgi:hypothetical protein
VPRLPLVLGKRARDEQCTLVYVMGPPGSGKTTLLRTLIESLPCAAATDDTKKIAWVRSQNVVVMGRWQGEGLHPDGVSKFAGRLDGCDRLWNGAANLIVNTDLLESLSSSGVRLIVADGPQILKANVVKEARRVGMRFRFLEIDVAAEVAHQRWQERDGAAFDPKKHTKWEALRDTWSGWPEWETMSATKIEGVLRDLMH